MGQRVTVTPRTAQELADADWQELFAAKKKQPQRRVISPSEKRARQFVGDLRAVLGRDRRS